MAYIPTFKLYDSTGTSLQYTFEYVTDIDDFQDPQSFVEHTSLRGQGSIISAGSTEPWDLTLTFMLKNTTYAGLVAEMNALLTTIAKNTKYVLKVGLTSTTTKDYKVKRLTSFQFPLDSRKKRITWQRVVCTFRVDAWA